MCVCKCLSIRYCPLCVFSVGTCHVPLFVCVYVGIVLHKDVFIYWVE